MNVLIRGMEMPRNCWECEFNKSTLDRMDFCTLTNKQYNWGLSERPSDCPLIELPPHGDLIDRDALRVDFLNRGIEGIQTDDFSELQQTIDDAPTVIKASDGEVMPDGTRR